MGSANRIAIVFLSLLAPVALASCGGSSPTAPTPAPPTAGQLTPGVYRFVMLSLGTSDGCSGGSLPGLGQVGGATFEVQLQAEGREWIARPRTPERGDFQLTLQTRDNDRLFTGTMRGRALDDSPARSQGTVDISQPATVDGSVSFVLPALALGRVNGELVYEQPSVPRVTCRSALWTLERR